MADLISLAPGVLLHTSRIMNTNSVVLASISEAFLIDPSWTPDELDDIALQLAERGLSVIGGFATHAHHDHLLWHPQFGNAPRLASPTTVKIVAAERDRLVNALLNTYDPVQDRVPEPHTPSWYSDLLGHLHSTPHAPANVHNLWLPLGVVPEGFHLELISHDAHIAGHTALWIPESRILLAGDMLSDEELPMPDLHSAARVAEILGWRRFDPFGAYFAALDLLEKYARQARVVIPGHGSVGNDALARVQRDRSYLQAIIAGDDPADPRRDHPGMAEWHEKLREAAACYT